MTLEPFSTPPDSSAPNSSPDDPGAVSNLTPEEPRHRSPGRWFWFGLIALFSLSLVLRFWGLGRFNKLVFDEVYFAQYARNYLTATPFFDGHPPLSKYLIAIGIWLGQMLPIGHDTANSETGTLLTTFSYRWLNALVGSCLPVLMGLLAWEASRRWRLALLAAGLMALDGLFLVESRYALNNIYLVGFGLLAHWFLLKALTTKIPSLPQAQRSPFWPWLIAAGLAFGGSISVKWNGSAFLIGAVLMWAWVKGQHWFDRALGRAPRDPAVESRTWVSPLQAIGELSRNQAAIVFAAIPALFYVLMWIPHLLQNPTKEPGSSLISDFFKVNHQILTYHQSIGDGDKVHPYCSRWYSWPLLLRPLAYVYARVADPNAPIDWKNPTPTLPASASPRIFDVHAMGNPILWWFALAALILTVYWLGRSLYRAIVVPPGAALGPMHTVTTPTLSWAGRHWQFSAGWESVLRPRRFTSLDLTLLIYFVVNYAANWLPWVRVTRCTFLYHYMGALAFSFLILAWWLDRWLIDRQNGRYIVAWSAIVLIILAFVFWLPIWLGLPISEFSWRLRIWYFGLKSFINWI